MSLEQLLHDERPGLERRLCRLVGDPEHAADLTQEALLRAWRSAPRDLPTPRQRAWLHRTGTNLAVDALRQRARRPSRPLHETDAPATGWEPTEAEGAREALGRLSAHERFVLLLRFEEGLSHREIGALLDLGEEAARKRVTRARASFITAWRAVRADQAPLVLLVEGEGDPASYRRWLQASGARVRVLRRGAVEREVALADDLVFCGTYADVAPASYGQPVRADIREADASRDRRDLQALRLALADGLPVLGVCRGAQLLNVALGGTLHQELRGSGVSGLDHDREQHPVLVSRASRLRRATGPQMVVRSDHHQAVDRLGRGLVVTGRGPDGVVEAVERPGRQFVLGLQWHPERASSGSAGAAVAEALLGAARPVAA